MMTDIFLQVLNMSIAGSWVILAVLLARLCLRKMPRKYSCVLWALAAFRLVCSVSVPSALSLFNLVRPTAEKTVLSAILPSVRYTYIPEDIGMMAEPQISVGIPAADKVLSASLPAPDTTMLTSINPMQVWTAAGTVVWCAGMAVLVGWTVVRYIRLRCQVRNAVRMPEHGGNVYECEKVSSPFILGVVRPKIYIPCGMEEEACRQVLLHERAHLRCGDHLTKLFAFAVLTLHWFNPLCWLAFMLFGRDTEMRCDETVLRETDAKSYSLALVNVASAGYVCRRYRVTGPLAFGETSVKERVKHVLSWKKPTLWVTAAAVLVCALAVVICGTDRMASPGAQMDSLQSAEILSTSVHVHGDMALAAELTPEQTETLARLLRDLPESAYSFGLCTRGWRTIMVMKAGTSGETAQSYAFLYDGEKLWMPTLSGSLSRYTAWYINDPSLLTFFGDLETAMENGQGTAPAGQHGETAESEDGVTVYVSGTDSSVSAAYFPDGWNFDYDSLPTLILTDSAHLCIHLNGWEEETLYVGEDYYKSLSETSTVVSRTTYTAAGPHEDGGYTIGVTRQNPDYAEKAVYYITRGEENREKFVFRIRFADTEEDAEVVPLTAEKLQAQGENAEAFRAPSDPDYRLPELIRTIAAEPAESSNPGDCIAAHPEEYTELLSYGTDALEYIFTRFLAGGETGLEGHIMKSALCTLLGEDAIAYDAPTGQDYFDVWFASVQKIYADYEGETFWNDHYAMWRCLYLAGVTG